MDSDNWIRLGGRIQHLHLKSNDKMADGQYNSFSGTTSYRIVPFLHQYTERVQMNLIFSYFNNYDKFNSNNNWIVMITITTAIQLRNIGEKKTDYL